MEITKNTILIVQFFMFTLTTLIFTFNERLDLDPRVRAGVGFNLPST